VGPLSGCVSERPQAGGSAPIRIGFIPLTDCASVVMAQELGLFEKYGVQVSIEKQASWPIVRDKLASGELDAAHCLFGMPLAAATGVSEIRGDPLQIAMMINNNGSGDDAVVRPLRRRGLRRLRGPAQGGRGAEAVP
jgi:nitrate/nitrite transport system substrate-binding protein